MRHLPRSIPRPQTGLGWAVLALVVAAVAKSVFGLQLPGWLRGGQGTKGGRWIKDRSLGGKMVRSQAEINPFHCSMANLTGAVLPSICFQVFRAG